MRSLFFLLGCVTLTLQAEPVPHATRGGRLVATRDGFSVEYSPGQEAWMEMAFARLQQEAAAPPVPAVPTAVPSGSPPDLHAHRDALLAAVARGIGRNEPAPIQVKTFDTFLGYYDMMAELYQVAAATLGERLKIRHVAIWQRDELIQRLRAGEKVPGVSYDPKTDQGNFEFGGSMELDADASARLKAINDAIQAQQLNHTFNYDKSGISASVTPHSPPPLKKAPDKNVPATPGFPEIVMPVLYQGAFDTAPTAAAFDYTWVNLHDFGHQLEERFRNYTDPNLVAIILHETTEAGLLDGIITSKDRRWLCDGTANFIAWQASRDCLGADFARRVYDLEAQLRLFAPLQSKVNLTRWSAAEKQNEGQKEAEINRAHYAFATRAMFMLAQQHGDDALSLLWHDVAQTDPKKVTAATFAKAYRKRYNGDLAALVKAAEKTPISIPPPEKH